MAYTSREDDGTGLYYYRARYYDPQLKRFVSADPIGLEGGINVYGYVGGSPVQFVDPSGLLHELSVGISLTIGGSPMFMFPFNPFVGGGVSISVKTNGQISLNFTSNAMIGVGAYAGVGISGSYSEYNEQQLGQNRNKCNDAPFFGLSTSDGFIVEGNVGAGASIGGSVTTSSDGQVVAGKSLGKFGGGVGAMIGFGWSRTSSISTPALW